MPSALISLTVAAPGARHDEVGDRERQVHPVDVALQRIACDAGIDELGLLPRDVQELPAGVEHVLPGAAEGRIELPGAERAAEHEERRTIGVESEVGGRLGAQPVTVEIDDLAAQRHPDHGAAPEPGPREGHPDSRRPGARPARWRARAWRWPRAPRTAPSRAPPRHRPAPTRSRRTPRPRRPPGRSGACGPGRSRPGTGPEKTRPRGSAAAGTAPCRRSAARSRAAAPGGPRAPPGCRGPARARQARARAAHRRRRAAD